VTVLRLVLFGLLWSHGQHAKESLISDKVDRPDAMLEGPLQEQMMSVSLDRPSAKPPAFGLL
jgi:hypothetical protein